MEFSGLAMRKRSVRHLYSKRLILIFILLIPMAVCIGQISQFPLQISGRVIADQGSIPISGANVQIAGTGWGTATDPDGYFEFRSIPEGSYQLKISHVSFISETVDIRIQPGIPQHLTVNLRPIIITLPEVSVEISGARDEFAVTRTIIDQRMIRQSGAKSVGDLLTDHGPVFIKEKGAAGSSQYASIRGSATNQVLVVMDDHRLNTPGMGEVDLSTIPLDAVERVEVITGPSPEYGGDAIGGVIRIITKSVGDLSERNLRAGGGSFGSRHGQFYLSRKGNPGVSFSGSIAASRGDYEYTDRFGQTMVRDNADMHSENLFWKAQGLIGGWKLALSASQYQVERGIPGDLDQLTPLARLEQRQQDARFTAKFVANRWEVSGLIFGGKDIAHHRNPDAFIPLDARHTEANAGGMVSWRGKLTERFQLHLSHESRWDGMSSPSVEHESVERWSHGSFIQSRYRIGIPRCFPLQNLQWKGTVRWDRLTDIADQWTYQTGFFWGRQGSLGYHVRGNLGTAFRAPTFTSLFWKEDVFSRGNPDLKPENSFNREIGGGISLSKFLNAQLNITGFWQDIENIILWRRGFDGRWAPYNVSKAEVNGIELSTKLSPVNEWMWVEYTGTFLKAINRSGESNYDGKDLTYRPRQISRLATGWQWRGWWADYSVQWVSRRYVRESNSMPLAAEGMGPYRLMDASVGRDLSLFGVDWQLKAEVRNLENREFRIVERSPMPGREWRASLRVEFQ